MTSAVPRSGFVVFCVVNPVLFISIRDIYTERLKRHVLSKLSTTLLTCLNLIAVTAQTCWTVWNTKIASFVNNSCWQAIKISGRKKLLKEKAMMWTSAVGYYLNAIVASELNSEPCFSKSWTSTLYSCGKCNLLSVHRRIIPHCSFHIEHNVACFLFWFWKMRLCIQQ